MLVQPEGYELGLEFHAFGIMIVCMCVKFVFIIFILVDDNIRICVVGRK